MREANRRAVLSWRRRFLAVFEEIAEVYPPNDNVDFDALGVVVSAVIEGCIVFSKALGEPHITAAQVMILRSSIELLFTPSRR